MNDNKTDGIRMVENGHVKEYWALLEPRDCGTHDEYTPGYVLSDWCEERGYFQLAKWWRTKPSGH